MRLLPSIQPGGCPPRIVKQKDETEKARKDMKEVMKTSFINVSEMELLDFKNFKTTLRVLSALYLLLYTLVCVRNFANFRQAEWFYLSVLALSFYLLSLLGLFYLWWSERRRKRKTSQELGEAAMHEYWPHIEKMWADPGCVDGLQQQVGHLQAQLPETHLLELRGLETTYPELLTRAVRAETNLQQERFHNQNLQAMLQQESGRNQALQRQLEALASVQERATGALTAIANRPNVVNNISNDNRTWNSTSYDNRSYDYRSYDNREYRSFSNYNYQEHRSITNHVVDQVCNLFLGRARASLSRHLLDI